MGFHPYITKGEQKYRRNPFYNAGRYFTALVAGILLTNRNRLANGTEES